MHISDFKLARIPQVYFGAGQLNNLNKIISTLYTISCKSKIQNQKPKIINVLIITGESSLRSSGRFDVIARSLKDSSINLHDLSFSGEPSPDMVDRAVSEFIEKDIGVAVSIGGGSVIDAGKAISAMLPTGDSVLDYLEGIGTKTHDGIKIPFIAIPTTSGAGSESTKNAVLSMIGADGFKKSLRHDNFIPDVAVIDLELILNCPSSITAACGMDAFAQLLESFVSTNASPITDALALSGLKQISGNLILASGKGADDINVRASMAYSSFISGITLANAGLGIVHGLASPIGGFFDIPHGVVCGTLIGAATRVNIEGLKKSREKGEIGLKKYTEVGALLTKCDSNDIDLCCRLLIEKLEGWIDELKLPPLSEYGIKESDLNRIIDGAGNKQNPVKLDKQEIRDLLMMRL